MNKNTRRILANGLSYYKEKIQISIFDLELYFKNKGIENPTKVVQWHNYGNWSQMDCEKADKLREMEKELEITKQLFNDLLE
jgi:hypothetical protein